MSDPPWQGEVELTLEGAQSLLRAQFPGVVSGPLRRLGRGWDNDALLVDDTWVFRFPRRRLAVPLIENEARLLPRLVSQLPVPVPHPEHLGQPSEEYPFPFVGYRSLQGITADRVLMETDPSAMLAAPVGRFLRALHSVPPVGDEPGDDLRRSDARSRLPVLEDRLRRLVSALPPQVSLEELLDTAQRSADAPPHRGPPVLVHGDLYSRHLLVDEQQDLVGVIDWGDLHRGDPALDLSFVIGFLQPDSRPAFFASYGLIDDETAARARFRALFHAAALLDYGLAVGDDFLAHSAGRSLQLGCR